MYCRAHLSVISILAFSILMLAAGGAAALNPDDELWATAATRGPGNDGSFWLTDLYILNLGEEETTVVVTWLERFADNSEAEGFPFDIAAGETLVLEDAISSVFGQIEAEGAIHIEVEEEEEEDGSKVSEIDEEEDSEIVATTRIYNLHDGETQGQGFEALISDAAISADDDPTHVVGVVDNDSYRSNWYGLNITMDEEDEPEEAEVLVEVLDLAGNVLVAETFTMAPLEPVLHSVASLGAGVLSNATLRFTMIEGEGLFGGSKIDRLTNDPTTLEAHWDCEDDSDLEFTTQLHVDECTFATSGSNPYWILQPGVELVLEGEDDGEEIAVTITVLDETLMVDGVETRVVREEETENGELTEISRNYMAFCVETASIFYFGEDVDIYEDGEIVAHHGAWLAGENGAEPGILMPGTVLDGSRYYQEVAPGIALDRAEHVALGLEVEVGAGTFEGCLLVEETTPLEPGEESIKVYAPGIGMIVDDDIELVEYTLPDDQ